VTVGLRPATRDDVPVIAELIRGLARYEKLEDQVEMTEALLAAGLFGERPYAEVVLAEEDGLAVGFALFFHNFSTFLGRPGIYLEDLFVLPEHRGRGIGRTLLAHLARLAVERGCGRLEWAVLDWNREAIGFYERLGARPLSEWTVYRLTGEALTRLARGK
jgi:GNAT superfamily N-acetyltransferase